MTIVRVADALAATRPMAAAVAAPGSIRSSSAMTGFDRQDLDQGGDRHGHGALGERTLKNEGNQNNEVGLPLTVLRLGPEHEAAVLEMGMYVGGEISRGLPAAIGRPRDRGGHGSATGCTSRASDRSTRSSVAKGKLVEALPRATDGGVAILNADDPRVTPVTATDTPRGRSPMASPTTPTCGRSTHGGSRS